MAVFEMVLYIVAAVVLSSFLSRFLPRISLPLVQIVLGLIASQLSFFPDTQLDPELFMVLFIAPLLYLEAHEIDKNALLRSLKLSLSLAIGLAVATMVAVGFILHSVWPIIPLAAALALGAALGPTDAVAVSSLSNEASLTSRQIGVLKGESLFNDASGIVGFQFAIAAAMTGVFQVGEAVSEFVVSFIGGTLFGIVMGLVVNWLFETIRTLGWETTTTRILMELFLPFLLYLGAESLHVSGILSVVAAGLLINFDRTGIGPNVARANIVSTSVWSVLSVSLNGTVFILLGMILPDAMRSSWDNANVSNAMLLGSISVVSVVVIGMRFLWIALMLRITRAEDTRQRRKMTKERWRSAAVMTFGGPKGTITLSLMFTIPFTVASGAWFPMRDELIFIAGGVIIVTLVLANFLLPVIAPHKGGDTSERMNEISVEVLRRTVEELADRTTDENRRALMPIIDSYTKRITRIKQMLGQVDMGAYQRLQIDALECEKEYVKQRLAELKRNIAEHAASTSAPTVVNTPQDVRDWSGDGSIQEAQIEACERLLDQIMHAMRRVDTDEQRGRISWLMRGRMRSLQRRATLLTRRVIGKFHRSTALSSEREIYTQLHLIQIDAFDRVIDWLYEQMAQDTYPTEYVSMLLMDYRRAEAALKSRPNMAGSMELLESIDRAKRESYGIELGVIQGMLEDGQITRAQARALRKNVYVMSVDADASV